MIEGPKASKAEDLNPKNVELSLAELAPMNKASNAFLALAAIGAVVAPAEGMPIAIAAALFGSKLKYNTIDAYSRMMVLFKRAGKRDPIDKARILAADVQGLCSQHGIELAFHRHFGADAERQLKRLNSPNFS